MAQKIDIGLPPVVVEARPVWQMSKDARAFSCIYNDEYW
jgi:hypothetical protein